MQGLKAAGAVPKWGMLEGELQRRTVFLRQLTEACLHMTDLVLFGPISKKSEVTADGGCSLQATLARRS